MPRFADMFVPEASDPRPEPPTQGDERQTLAGALPDHALIEEAWRRRAGE